MLTWLYKKLKSHSEIVFQGLFVLWDKDGNVTLLTITETHFRLLYFCLHFKGQLSNASSPMNSVHDREDGGIEAHVHLLEAALV